MPIFSKQENTQAYLKAGIMGFAGDGKTYTACEIAIGLIHLMRDRGIEYADKPVMFLDTETGSDWVAPRFAQEGIEMMTAKTRAFVDLIPAVKEAEKDGSILLIDSITHFWRELTESYAERKERKSGLLFQDWAWLKKQWGNFTDVFVNSQAHIIMCGRAGYEYDFFVNESGKKELEKTGIKMRAETETGYEPSILILMEKHQDLESKKIYRTASVLKDRSTIIDGKTFRNPTFEDFRPHVEFLNLGGKQIGVDTTRNSNGIIERDGKSQWQLDKEQKEIVLEEIQGLLVKHYPSTSGADKKAKQGMIENHFGTLSWKKVETLRLEDLRKGFAGIKNDLEGVGAYGYLEDEQDRELEFSILIGEAETLDALDEVESLIADTFTGDDKKRMYEVAENRRKELSEE